MSSRKWNEPADSNSESNKALWVSLGSALLAVLVIGLMFGRSSTSDSTSYSETTYSGTTSVSQNNYSKTADPKPVPVPQYSVQNIPAPVAPTKQNTVTPTINPSPRVSYSTATVPTTKPATADVAENGSYYGEPNANGVPKTVEVHGYYRKDGTYVRGHYRSAPNSNPPSSRSRR